MTYHVGWSSCRVEARCALNQAHRGNGFLRLMGCDLAIVRGRVVRWLWQARQIHHRGTEARRRKRMCFALSTQRFMPGAGSTHSRSRRNANRVMPGEGPA
jgi:uncharacterized membrane-anchored protein